MSTCKFCSNEIEWQENNGKYIPMNLNNSPHRCKSENKQSTLKDNNAITNAMKEVYASVRKLEDLLK